jgi:branched-chain amino acid transport system permease protein
MNAVIRTKVPVPLPAIPVVGALAGLGFGIVFGSVSTRRAGTVFAMISLGLGELVAASSLILRVFFGGEEGISTNRTRLAPLLGYKFGPQIEVFYLIAAWTFVCILAMYAITRTPFGRMCNAVREHPERVEFIGYRTYAIRFIAFSLAGLFAGVAGALAAINFEIMNVQSVGAAQSGIVLLMTFVGGIGAFVGPIIGAILITFLQLMLSDVTGAWMLYFGLLFIIVVMFFPEGIAGWLGMHLPVIRNGLIGLLLPSYLLIAGPLIAAVVGCILLVEVAHHMLVEAASEGSSMKMFAVAFDAASPVPWVIALVLFFGGAWLTSRLWPHVSGAWSDVLAKMHKRVAA